MCPPGPQALGAALGQHLLPLHRTKELPPEPPVLFSQTYFFSSILSSTACLAWSPFACTWSLPYLVGHSKGAVSIPDSAVSQHCLFSLHITPSSARGLG